MSGRFAVSHSLADSAPPTDRWGWAFVAIPAAVGLAELLVDWPSLGDTVLQIFTVLGTLVLIAVDGHRWGRSTRHYVALALFCWIVFFPLYVHRRAAWGGRRLVGFVIPSVVLFFTAPYVRDVFVREAARAEVSCRPAGALLGAGLVCSVKHVAGADSVEVAWDVLLTCDNGPGVSAHARATVAPHESTEIAIPFSQLTGAKGCDRPTNLELPNVVVTPVPGE